MNHTTVNTMSSAARRLFIPAAIFNWSVAAGLLLLSDVMGPLLRLDPVSGTNLALRDMSMLLVALFGFAYWRIAFDPQRFRPYIELGHSSGLVEPTEARYDKASQFAGHCVNDCVMQPVGNIQEMNGVVDKIVTSPRTAGFCGGCADHLTTG